MRCLDTGNSGDPGSIAVDVSAGTRIDIFVDSYSNASSGSFELSVTPD